MIPLPIPPDDTARNWTTVVAALCSIGLSLLTGCTCYDCECDAPRRDFAVDQDVSAEELAELQSDIGEPDAQSLTCYQVCVGILDTDWLVDIDTCVWILDEPTDSTASTDNTASADSIASADGTASPVSSASTDSTASADNTESPSGHIQCNGTLQEYVCG